MMFSDVLSLPQDWIALLQVRVYDNTLAHWMLATGITILVMMGASLAKLLLGSQLKKVVSRTETDLDDFLLDLFNGLNGLLFLALALQTGTLFLTLPPKVDAVLHMALILAGLFQLAVWGNRGIDYGLKKAVEQAPKDHTLKTMAGPLRVLASLLLWSLIGVLALDNMGVHVTALLAGLGVGGIAVALAVQNILGDLLAAFSIVLDKPFRVGDVISGKDWTGTVSKIGLKTTRIRSINGELILFSNSELLKNRLQNFRSLTERRVLFQTRVAYHTPPTQVAAIPAIIQSIIEAQPETRFDRAHLASLGDWALVFETAYFVKSADYNQFMDTQQAVLHGILEKFQAEGIALATSLPPVPTA